MQMRVVLIPSWVEQALLAAKKPLATALDVVALSSTISKDDLAIYIDVNNRLLPKLFQPLYDTFANVTLYPYNAGESDEVKALRESLDIKLRNITIEKPQPDFTQLVNQHIIFTDDDQPVGSFATHYTFEVFPLVDEVIGVRAVLRKPDESDVLEDIRAYDNLLKLMNTFMSMEEMAKTPIFNVYTYLLRNAVAA